MDFILSKIRLKLNNFIFSDGDSRKLTLHNHILIDLDTLYQSGPIEP